MNGKILIETLGGATRISREMGINPQTVSNWPKRGIPAHAWPALLDLARRKGVKLSTDLHETALAASRRSLRQRSPQDRAS
ncbi:MAG: hypothetical protein H6851_09660 [Geminicoccaceae bacterium]|nr:hypothetical protein [Geminicoccaceae bacterium]MCB9943871.1 hypothetical protein [Geminicoccaceae bacterium]